MLKIETSEKIKTACPGFVGAAISATVQNSAEDKLLWKKIEACSADYRLHNTLDDIKKNTAIAATRSVYKQFGKDPNRYRPSAEALCRRILRGLPLYQINTLVDIINLVSIETGYSIGGFDAGKIEGDSLLLGVGECEEPFEGIGRGVLNIEGLPVYRDRVGGIGTPTSDNERTKLDMGTTHVLVIINAYSGRDGLDHAVGLMVDLLEEFTDAKELEILYF